MDKKPSNKIITEGEHAGLSEYTVWNYHTPFPCPVCGTSVEAEQVCPICMWENTGRINIDGGPNQMTLKEAQKAWKEGRPVL